ncbi:MAG: DNA mismatch repair protein MutS, partial [Erysipelothrix sp.]|nr:DNA mismatch repair protein MutS [Erysipelothrix sp.]
GCNTIFSTHYHELTSLEDMHEGIKNIHVEVHEEDDEITFLYRVIEGRSNRSYGINVAKLAHLPKTVIERASQTLNLLESQKENVNLNAESILIEVEPKGYQETKELLDKVDINQMTPMEALMLLSELKEKMGD